MGPTLIASYMYLLVDFTAPPNLVISTRAPRILLLDMPIAFKVLKAMRLSEAPVSISALMIWMPFMVAIK